MSGTNAKDVVISLRFPRPLKEKVDNIADLVFSGNRSWLFRDALGIQFSRFLAGLERARELRKEGKIPDPYDENIDPITATAIFIMYEVPPTEWDELEKELKEALKIIKEELRRTRF